MQKENSIVLMSRAGEMLAQANTVQKAKELKDLALTAKDWAERKKLGSEAIDHARRYSLLAEDRMGELLKDNIPHTGGRPAKTISAHDGFTKLKDIGVSLNESMNAQRFHALPDDLKNAAIEGKTPKSRALRIARDRKAEESRSSESPKSEVDPNVTIIHGDFREAFRDLKDVDLILTDPPYGKEYLPLLRDLASWSNDCLKEDGLLAVMFGQTWLPEVFEQLSTGRTYRWTIACAMPGPAYVSHARKLQSKWKPVLIYGNGPRFDDLIIPDLEGQASAKDFHKWGQQLPVFEELIRRLAKPGQLVCDPFCGGGTTLLAAKLFGCSAMGCDIDEQSIKTAKRRCV